jgi:trans-aconitate methyltransferase
MSDPYRMMSEAERTRFAMTNEFLVRHVSEIDTIFEFGCGEGHQTSEFQRIARNVIGLDVSASAIKRARIRCPEAKFLSGDIMAMSRGESLRHVTVVTACEVLYYLSDVEAYLRLFETIAQYVLVTYLNVEKYVCRLDPLVQSRPDVLQDSAAFVGVEWKMALWKTSR